MPQPLGRRMAALRRELDITQDDFALQLGVAQSCVSRWEAEEAAVPDKVIAPAAAILKVSPAMLEALRIPSWAVPKQTLASRLGLSGEDREMPPYNWKYELEDFRNLGWYARELHDRVLGRGLPLWTEVEMRERFPRDSPLEIFFAFHMFDWGGHMAFHSPLSAGCTAPVLLTNEAIYAGHLRRHTLVLETKLYSPIAFPQVWLPSVLQSKYHRMDFLALFVRKDRPGRVWSNLEMDGWRHKDTVEADDQRTRGLGVPRLGYTQGQLQRADFMDRLVADLSSLCNAFPTRTLLSARAS
jgi:transcriptional regulator with XRE-family HTH domain